MTKYFEFIRRLENNLLDLINNENTYITCKYLLQQQCHWKHIIALGLSLALQCGPDHLIYSKPPFLPFHLRDGSRDTEAG